MHARDIRYDHILFILKKSTPKQTVEKDTFSCRLYVEYYKYSSTIINRGIPSSRSARDGHGKTPRGVNRRPHLHPHIARVFIQFEIVPLQHHGETRGRLEHRELIADALSRPRAEGNEREVRRHLVWIQPGDEIGVIPRPVFHAGVVERSFEPHGIELLGFFPAIRRSVKVPHADEDVHALDERDVGVAGAARKGNVLQAGPYNNLLTLRRSVIYAPVNFL